MTPPKKWIGKSEVEWPGKAKSLAANEECKAIILAYSRLKRGILALIIEILYLLLSCQYSNGNSGSLHESPRAHFHVVEMLRFMSLTQINRPCPFLFILFLCLFLSLWPFQPYFISYILPTTHRFLALFFRSYFCLVGPFSYISFYESLPQHWYNPFWLTGLKAPTN